MEDIYENFSQRRYQLNLIQYYELYDQNGDQGVIQGLRYYPRDVNTVIPNNPELDTKINYYKPYTNPRVVLPKPRYKKRLSRMNQDNNALNNNDLNTLNQQNFLNAENSKENNEVYKTFRRNYNNEKEEQISS